MKKGRGVFATLLALAAVVATAVVSSTASAARSASDGSSASASPPAFTMSVPKGATTTVGQLGTPAAPGDSMARSFEWRGPKRLGKSPLRLDPLSPAPRVRPARNHSGGQGDEDGDNDDNERTGVQLLNDWEGLDHRDSRLAFNGNQFSGEPPDQGLCVGNGMVLETVNSALRVDDARTGAPLSRVVALNELYGFKPAINRQTGEFGPFTFDISCHYDRQTDRWFHLAVDLDQDPVSGDFTGRNYLDLAVTHSGDPRGAWTTYRIPAINDGTEGTPDHNCAGGPCFGDYPHIGADANGIYITTNEFPLFEDGFTGAQVYAISKRQLASLPANLRVTAFNTADAPVRPGEPGFTVWPALSPGADFDRSNGGTQYFVSSNAVFDDADADSRELIVWGLTNTRSLDAATVSLRLQHTIVGVNRYTVPGNVPQKPGAIPLADCLNNDTLPTPFGPGCWQLFLTENPPTQVLGPLDSGDSRIVGVSYANEKLWAVLGTGATVRGNVRTGVGWFILRTNSDNGEVRARVDKQGILALARASLAYPTVGVTRQGIGALAFTLVGERDHPSAAYAAISDDGVGPVRIAEAGRSPQDGFTEYPPLGGNRPRWGDYSAAAVDGNSIWLATEYIGDAPCTLEQYLDGFSLNSCRSTGTPRTSLANWGTRVMRVRGER